MLAIHLGLIWNTSKVESSEKLSLNKETPKIVGISETECREWRNFWVWAQIYAYAEEASSTKRLIRKQKHRIWVEAQVF